VVAPDVPFDQAKLTLAWVEVAVKFAEGVLQEITALLALTSG
jgi:hypothetical protein